MQTSLTRTCVLLLLVCKQTTADLQCWVHVRAGSWLVCQQLSTTQHDCKLKQSQVTCAPRSCTREWGNFAHTHMCTHTHTRYNPSAFQHVRSVMQTSRRPSLCSTRMATDTSASRSWRASCAASVWTRPRTRSSRSSPRSTWTASEQQSSCQTKTDCTWMRWARQPADHAHKSDRTRESGSCR